MTPVAFQGDPHALGQALQADVLFEAFELSGGDAGHARFPLKTRQDLSSIFLSLIFVSTICTITGHSEEGTMVVQPL